MFFIYLIFLLINFVLKYENLYHVALYYKIILEFSLYYRLYSWKRYFSECNVRNIIKILKIRTFSCRSIVFLSLCPIILYLIILRLSNQYHHAYYNFLNFHRIFWGFAFRGFVIFYYYFLTRFHCICFRYGSLTQASTVKLGRTVKGEDVYVPISSMLPMVNPNDIEIDGWDISDVNLAEAMMRAKVLDVNLQVQLRPYMAQMRPRKSIYYSDFIASNQVIIIAIEFRIAYGIYPQNWFFDDGIIESM